MNSMDFIRFADVIVSPAEIATDLISGYLPIILIIAVIIAAVLIIRHFKGRKK